MIPYKFKNIRILGTASADTQPDRENGSRLYDVNLWLWRYTRGQPKTMCIDEAEAAGRIKSARQEKGRRRQRTAAGRRQPS